MLWISKKGGCGLQVRRGEGKGERERGKKVFSKRKKKMWVSRNLPLPLPLLSPSLPLLPFHSFFFSQVKLMKKLSTNLSKSSKIVLIKSLELPLICTHQTSVTLVTPLNRIWCQMGILLRFVRSSFFLFFYIY